MFRNTSGLAKCNSWNIDLIFPTNFPLFLEQSRFIELLLWNVFPRWFTSLTHGSGLPLRTIGLTCIVLMGFFENMMHLVLEHLKRRGFLWLLENYKYILWRFDVACFFKWYLWGKVRYKSKEYIWNSKLNSQRVWKYCNVKKLKNKNIYK